MKKIIRDEKGRFIKTKNLNQKRVMCKCEIKELNIDGFKQKIIELK